MTSIGSYAPDFELPGVDGSVHHLARYLEQFSAVGLVIMSNCCPRVQSYIDRLKQIQTEFQAQGLRLIGMNANDDRNAPGESFEAMKRFASDRQLNFPYLRDPTQEVARSLGASRTPEAFLIDRTCILRYSGAIDSGIVDCAASYAAVDAAQETAGPIAYFHQAIAQLLAGLPIEPALTVPLGNEIQWRL